MNHTYTWIILLHIYHTFFFPWENFVLLSETYIAHACFYHYTFLSKRIWDHNKFNKMSHSAILHAFRLPRNWVNYTVSLHKYIHWIIITLKLALIKKTQSRLSFIDLVDFPLYSTSFYVYNYRRSNGIFKSNRFWNWTDVLIPMCYVPRKNMKY